MEYAWQTLCTIPNTAQVEDWMAVRWPLHSLLLPFWEGKIDKTERGMGQKQSKKERIKFLDCLHTIRNTYWKAWIRSGNENKHRTLGVCSWLLPLPLTLSKSADLSTCNIIFPQTLILTSWGYLKENVSNNILCLHHSFHRELKSFFIYWEWSFLWEINVSIHFLEMNLSHKSLNLMHCRVTYGT